MYNDFPILDNQEYYKLNAAYNSTKNYSFNDSINLVLKKLSDCLAVSFNPQKVVNLRLAKCVNDARDSINLAIENINLIFNTNVQTKEVKEFNVFVLLYQLIDIVGELQKIFTNEQKIYHKTITQKTASQLLQAASNLAKELSLSNIKLYKFI